MATYYVSHLATGANNGSSWADAFTSLGDCAAGDVVYVLNTHYELTTANVTLTFGSSVANLAHVVSVNHALELSPGARFTGGVTRTTTVLGAAYIFGIDFTSAGYGPTVLARTTDAYLYCEQCGFGAVAGSGTALTLGGSNFGRNEVVLKDCTWSVFGATSAMILAAGRITIQGGRAVRGGSLTGALPSGAPLRIFNTLSATTDVKIDSFDFSIFKSTGPLFSVNGTVGTGTPVISRCKMPAGWGGGLGYDLGLKVLMDACDPGTNVWRHKTTSILGETEVIDSFARLGGAEENGVRVSYFMTTSAGAQRGRPLESPVLHRNYPGNPTEAAAFTPGAPVTVVVEIHSNSADLTDRSCWLEVTSFDSADSVLGSVASSAPQSVLAPPTPLPTSDAVWLDYSNAVAGGYCYQLRATIYPQLPGYISAVVKTAEFARVRVCPRMRLI